MQTTVEQVVELRALFDKVKMAFTQVPPHPAHAPQGPPQGQMPPEAMQGQMPPEGMPPEAMQGQMPPEGMPPEGGPPPELMGILDQMVGKIEQIGQESQQKIQTLEQSNMQFSQELQMIKQELASEKERRKMLASTGII